MAIAQPKKIVAVCNYGGWFELKEDGSIECCDWEAHAVDVHENMQLNDLKKEVAKYVDASEEGMLVKFFLPGKNKKYLIDVLTDDAFKTMRSYYKDSDKLEIFIIQEPSAVGTNRSQKRRAETQVVVNSPPSERDQQNLDPLNKVVSTETINEVTEIPNPTRHEPPVAAKQWENLITGVGQRFNSVEELRVTLKKYAIAHGFNYVYKKNEKGRLTVKCESENCQWRMHASKPKTAQQVMYIKTMTETHSCQPGSVITASRAKGKLFGEILMENVKDNPKIKPKEFAEKLRSEYGVEANYTKVRRAREYAREQLLGSYEEECSEIAYKCQKLMEVNPGSIAKLSTDEGLRLFVAFNASVSGFIKGCRPLLFLHSTPFNSRMLLSAASVDGNDNEFPVAFAVVDEENNDNWRWFLTELKSLVSGHGPITFVTKGLSEPLGEVFGVECYHAFCLEYLREKLNEDLAHHLSNDRMPMLVDLYLAAQTSKLDDFEKFLQSIKAESLEAYNWIISSEPDHWANARFAGLPHNHLIQNFGQYFYSCVSKANGLSIPQLVDKLMDKMMHLIYTRRAESSQWVTQLTPLMEEELRKKILDSQSAKVLEACESKFEVSISKLAEIVDMENFSCSCGGWLLTGLPCCHAIAVLELEYGRSPYDYCSSYFHVEMYYSAYEDSINPIPDMERITDGMAHVTQPAVWTPGKAKKRKVEPGRVVPADYAKRPLQCGRCKGFGHNKRSCKEIIQESETAS